MSLLNLIKIKVSKKSFFFVLTVFTGLLLFYPVLDYQGLLFTTLLDGFLAQGDHGVNLYAVQANLRGEIPYHDYFWVYGPLMPHYYGFFYKFFGMNIQSILIGKCALIILSGVVVYITLSLITTSAFAYLGAFFYFVFEQNFRHTYNHAGGTLMMLVILCFLFLYIQRGQIRHLYYAMFSIFVLSMIKLNMGLFTLPAFIVSVFVIQKMKGNRFSHKERNTYLFGLLALTAFIVFVYSAFLQGLPIYVVRQCFPYLREDHPYNVPIWTAIKALFLFIIENFTNSLPSLIFSIFVSLTIIYWITLFFKKNVDRPSKQNMFLCIVIPLIFCFFVLHEFWTSGIRYRSYWAKPFNVFMICTFISFSLNRLQEKRQTLCFILLFSWLIIVSFQKISVLMQIKTHRHFFEHTKARVYVKNLPPWIETVTQATKYLEQNLKENELFFALPYDPLYYYLTDRRSPTRQLIFFGEQNIPQEQEVSTIADLEKHNINYILFSNRAYSGEGKLGLLGETHCPLLVDYIFQNFEPVASFGDWDAAPRWAWAHAVKILRRKQQ